MLNSAGARSSDVAMESKVSREATATDGFSLGTAFTLVFLAATLLCTAYLHPFSWSAAEQARFHGRDQKPFEESAQLVEENCPIEKVPHWTLPAGTDPLELVWQTVDVPIPRPKAWCGNCRFAEVEHEIRMLRLHPEIALLRDRAALVLLSAKKGRWEDAAVLGSLPRIDLLEPSVELEVNEDQISHLAYKDRVSWQIVRRDGELHVLAKRSSSESPCTQQARTMLFACFSPIRPAEKPMHRRHRTGRFTKSVPRPLKT